MRHILFYFRTLYKLLYLLFKYSSLLIIYFQDMLLSTLVTHTFFIVSFILIMGLKFIGTTCSHTIYAVAATENV